MLVALSVFLCFLGARCCVWLLECGCYVSTILPVVLVFKVSERCFLCLLRGTCCCVFLLLYLIVRLVYTVCGCYASVAECCLWLFSYCALLCLIPLFYAVVSSYYASARCSV